MSNTSSAFKILCFGLLVLSWDTCVWGQSLSVEANESHCWNTSQPIPLSEFVFIEGNETDLIDGLQIAIASNYDPGNDGFSYTAVSGISGNFDASNGIFTLTGAGLSRDYNLALSQLEFNSFDRLQSKMLTVTLSGVDFYTSTGHFYQFFNAPSISWADAKQEAENKSLFGLQGYLTTITSSGENNFILSRVSGTAWIGASDEATEGDWRWVTGPEGLENGGSGMRLTDGFTNWNAGEPNNAGPEHYAHMMDWSTPPGQWNDLSVEGGPGQFEPTGYIVEYGGLPGEPDISQNLSKTIVLDPRQDPSINGSVSVCPNITGVTYAATDLSNHSYEWTVNGGIITSGQNSNEITVTWGNTNPNAEVRLSMNSDLSCAYELTFAVRVNEKLEPPQPQGPDAVCFLDLNSPQTYQTPFTNGSSYQWQVTGGTVVSGQGSNVVQVLWEQPGTGSIFFTESTSTATDICDGDSPHLQVLLKQQIVPELNLTPVSCFGGSDGKVNVSGFTSDDQVAFEWETAGLGQVNGNGIDGLPAGNYEVKISKDGCELSVPFVITEPIVLEGEVAISDVLCFGESNGQAEAIISGGTPPYTYQWSHDTTFFDTQVNNLFAGNYQVQIADANACELVLNFRVNEPEILVIAEIVSTLVSCPEGSNGTLEAFVTGGTPPYVYTWENNPSSVSLAEGFPKGVYEVTVTDANGCSTKESGTVEEAIPKIILPNAFSPNGDNQNDTFKPPTICSVIFLMTIYNKWGNVIFHTNDITLGWDGTFEGNDAPPGRYTYTASWTIVANGRSINQTEKGTLQLVR